LRFPRRHLFRFCVALVTFALVACGGTEQASPSATPLPTPTAQSILEMASRRLADTSSAHFALDVQGDTFVDSAHSIRILGAEGDLVRPDRVRTTFQVEVLKRAIELQLISIGDASWTTNVLTGEWGHAPLEFAYRPEILFSTQDGIGPMMGRVENVARLADEKISGRPAYHLQAKVDQSVVGPLTYNTLSGSPVTVDLWIDQETHDLLQARMAEPPGPERPNPGVWTLELSHHDEDVAIEPPTDVSAATPSSQ
jgi:hypothetical protein